MINAHSLLWFGLNLEDLLKIISLLGTFLAWLQLNRRRPRLEAFFTHGAAHPIVNTQNFIHTHSLVVRNAGSYPATGVRISHSFMPPTTDIQMFPDRPRTTVQFGQYGSEILIDRLRPKEQITLSYLYPGPTLFSQFGTLVKFDDGFAQFFEIQQVRIFPPWVRAVILYLMAAGFCLSLYIALKSALFFFSIT
jgi:hypothetical protein